MLFSIEKKTIPDGQYVEWFRALNEPDVFLGKTLAMVLV